MRVQILRRPNMPDQPIDWTNYQVTITPQLRPGAAPDSPEMGVGKPDTHPGPSVPEWSRWGAVRLGLTLLIWGSGLLGLLECFRKAHHLTREWASTDTESLGSSGVQSGV